jgi:transcriptional regulator
VYVPAFTAVDEDHALAMVTAVASGWLVTAAEGGPPEATLMPILWRGDRIIAHMAKANPHWRHIINGMPGLMIVTGPEAYISPSWYATKSEHGRVVPTWNYLAVHLTGSVHIHPEPAWVQDAVTDLTNEHENNRANPWHVSDAPADYIDAQLKAIIGIELRIERVEGKAKLSQNRSEPDRHGVINGLRTDPDPRSGTAIAEAMNADVVDPLKRESQGASFVSGRSRLRGQMPFVVPASDRSEWAPSTLLMH